MRKDQGQTIHIADTVFAMVDKKIGPSEYTHTTWSFCYILRFVKTALIVHDTDPYTIDMCVYAEVGQEQE